MIAYPAACGAHLSAQRKRVWDTAEDRKTSQPNVASQWETQLCCSALQRTTREQQSTQQCDAIKNDTETHIRIFININFNKSAEYNG